ncbi:MAG: hypothetical protein AAF715_20770 [Myxococcota bacterium]
MPGRFTYRLAMATLGLAVGSCLYDFDSYAPREGPAPFPADGEACPTVGAEAPCYDGPTVTRGVGRCRPGTRSCTEDGWTTCVGQSTPVPEDCLNVEDDDCDGAVDDDDADCACAPGGAADCYSGPAGTLDVGICRRGRRDCDMPSGLCLGEVVPVLEQCGNGRDDDCDGDVDRGCATGSVCFPNLGATETVRGARSREGYAIVAGTVEGIVEIGGPALPAAGLLDIFVAAYSSDLAHVWSRSFGGPGPDDAYGLDVADDGDVLVAGSYRSAWTFGGTDLPTTNQDRAAVFMLDSQGSPAGAVVAGETNPNASAVAVSRALDVATARTGGGAFVVGEYEGPIAFGPDSFDANSVGLDAFVARFDRTSGTFTWAESFGNGAHDHSLTTVITTEDGDDPIAAGQFRGATSVLGTTVQSLGDDANALVVRLDGASGQAVFVTTLRTTGSATISAMATLGDDFIVVGSYSGTLDVGDGTTLLPAAAGTDPFVARMRASDGTVVWHRTATDHAGVSPAVQRGFSVAVDDETDRIFVGLAVRGITVVGGHEVAAAAPGGTESDDAVLWQLNASGATERVLRFGDATDQNLFGLTVLEDGRVFAALSAQGRIDFGAGPIDLDFNQPPDICLALFPGD